MSLLEDVFLRDETDEAQELERVIDGDDFDERPRYRSDSDGDSERSNEAEEDKRKVDPSSTKTRRVIKNPRFVLNPARLTGPRGIHVIPEHFQDFKFKGKGHEREDLDLVLKKLEHWAYRLYPKFKFEDCLKKIETLGKKRPVIVNLHKIRSDQFTAEEPVVQKDSSDDEASQDEFDKLLQQQIDLARANDAKDKIQSPMRDNVFFASPQATSSPSMNEDQKERMFRNRRLAEERRKARLLANTNKTEVIPGITDDDNVSKQNGVGIDADIPMLKKTGSNSIDSSDEEIQVVNKSITVDVHNGSGRRMDHGDGNDESKDGDATNDVIEGDVIDDNNESGNKTPEQNNEIPNERNSNEKELSDVKSKESEVNEDLMDLDFNDEF